MTIFFALIIKRISCLKTTYYLHFFFVLLVFIYFYIFSIMASFKVKLFIDDEERNVLNVEHAFNQIVDITGRPDGLPYGKQLHITLESTVDDSFFYHQMFSPTESIQGELVFYKRDGHSVLHKLEFANAHVLGLTEDFDAYGEAPLNFSVKIGWGILKMNGILFEEAWNPNNPYEEAEATTIEHLEPEIVSLRYLNADGTEIEILEEDGDKKVYLEIVTENCIGKLVDIDLSDDEFNFEYRGELLEDDFLEGLEITSDTQKIELVIFEEDED